jgi:hypothetical protein
MKLKFCFAGLIALLTLNVFATQDLQTTNMLDSVLFTDVVQPDIDVDLYSVRTIARLTAGPKLQRHSVRVRNCGTDISHVKLIVSHRALIVRGVGVIFSDGSVNSFGYSRTFPVGYQSSWISLSSFRRPGRCVTGVFVNARSEDPRSYSKIQILGQFR